MIRRTLLLGVAVLLGMPSVAGAVDAVTSASRRAVRAGTPEAGIWIGGRGFQPGDTVMISGDGIVPQRDPVVVPEADRVDGGRGDGIAYYFEITAAATPGQRNITVTGADGSSATGNGIFEVLAGQGQPPPPPPPGADAGVAPPPPGDDELPPQPGRVDVVSRASPNFGEQGAQVNVWIIGRSFTPGLTVTFSVAGLAPAEIDGQPIPYELKRNAESEGGRADGITYYLRVPSETPLGFVDITVTNPDGSSATGQRLFEIVKPGAAPAPRPGDGDVDSVSGASPRALRAGSTASLWVWGQGIEAGARVQYSSPSVQAFAEPEVVIHAQSHPGFSGIRNYVHVDPSALPGPVDITVVNANGTQAVGAGILALVEKAGGGGAAPGDSSGGGAIGDLGPCPDDVTTIEAVTRIVPDKLARGESVNLAIQGRAFACGASVQISGGGLRALGAPFLDRDALDPYQTTLFWQLEIADDAVTGPRDVTVVNPNNSSKTLPAAFEIRAGESASSGGVAFCAATLGQAPPPISLLFLLPVPLLLRRQLRRT